jgi:inhibitor of cysteine peptidase
MVRGMADILLSGADSGSAYSARRGDVIVVSLDESPTSGYRWDLEHLPEVLAPVGSEFIEAPGGGLGGGGTRVLRFEARSDGGGVLALRRWRSWEGEGSVAERFTTTVTVV